MPDAGSQAPRAQMASPSPTEYNLPIGERKRGTDYARTLCFSFAFNASLFFWHIFHVGCFLLFYPLHATRPYSEATSQFIKGYFGRLIIIISQLFAPTKLVLTCSDEQGNVINPEKLVKRNSQGRVVQVDLPPKSVWISNHQIYTDWLYLWNLAYFAGLSDSVIIILLKLYKWVPLIGPSMQLFRFIFLARKWDSDKHLLAHKLSKIAQIASDKNADPMARASASKLLLLIFPEGTLVSPLTRPISKKYADKIGIEECRNLLLPRSTGLFFVLRGLAADIEDLKLLDFTIGYPGVPSAGRAQEFYTLRSTFMQGVAPPAVHMHLTIFSLKSSAINAPPLGPLPSTAAHAAKQEAADQDKKAFDDWLLKRWREKDERLTRFYADGDFMDGAYASKKSKGADAVPFVEVPTRLVSNIELWETLLASLIVLASAIWLLSKLFARG